MCTRAPDNLRVFTCFNQCLQETFGTQRTFVFPVFLFISILTVFETSLVAGRVLLNKICLYIPPSFHPSIEAFLWNWILGFFLNLEMMLKTHMKLWFSEVIEKFTHYLLLNSV